MIGWCRPVSTCQAVGHNRRPNNLSCTLYVSVFVCVCVDRRSVHTRLIISVIDGHLSLHTVDNLLWDRGLSEQDEHQSIYCIWRD